ncbi:hypothetical protein PUN28_002296 [Cardiocondyla obscurior]|uniref:Uncharacterized protein n=1 Tax=Cardiocondyla obscurior TaxID=286306 RepID=A0AAW2GTF9_9HYME
MSRDDERLRLPLSRISTILTRNSLPIQIAACSSSLKSKRNSLCLLIVTFSLGTRYILTYKSIRRNAFIARTLPYFHSSENCLRPVWVCKETPVYMYVYIYIFFLFFFL